MRIVGARFGMAALLACSAAQVACQGVAARPVEQEFVQDLMDKARRLTAAGKNIVLRSRSLKPGPSAVEDAVFVFYNNPRPFCYAYIIPGTWVDAPGPNAYRSKDGKAFVGVIFQPAGTLEGVEGATLIAQAQNDFVRWYEKASEQSVTAARLVPFESARGQTWKWTGLPLMRAEGQSPSTRIIVDLTPDAVVHVTIHGTADDDGLARRIIETLQTTKTPECYFPVLERMLRAPWHTAP